MMDAFEAMTFYKQMERDKPNSGILREVKWQYADMAQGGDGGELGFERNGADTCRGVNYKGCPDSYFQAVCALMNWFW